MNPYIVVGMIVYNEEFFIKHCISSVYEKVNEFVIVDSFSTDKTLDIIKSIDVDKKITIIQKKWINNYSIQRNYYLDYIKKNIWPKYKNNTWYLRIDADEIYHDEWIDQAKNIIEENPEIEGIRSNFYSFTQDLNHLDTKQPTESRVSLFRYTPDIEYRNKLHEMPVHKNNGLPLYASPMDDKRLGIFYSNGYAYLHYSWTDPKRCFQKAVNYTKTYVEQGTETTEHLNSIEPTKDSWWWNKVSDIKYNGKLPNVFQKLGLLDGQENPTEENSTPKFSVYTIIKNCIKFDYPIIEAINSILPIADEIIVNCGDSQDGTTGLIHKAFDGIEKVKIFERKWDGKDKGTLFLRKESNWAKDQCKNKIVLYLQADEIYHEDDLSKILEAVKTLEERQDLLGAEFRWRHFDGDFGTINPYSYPVEVRLIKKDLLESIGDAQSMGISQTENKINVMATPELLLKTDVRVFHVGWAKEPKKMLDKLTDFDGYYHTESEVIEMHKNDNNRHKNGEYNYGSRDSHIKSEEFLPSVLYPRVERYEKKYIVKNTAKFKGD